MKLNIDLSNTEFNAMVSKMTEGARREVELSAILAATQSQLYKAQSELRDAQWKLNDMNANYENTLASARADIDYYKNRAAQESNGGLAAVPCTPEVMREALKILAGFMKTNPAVIPALPLLKNLVKGEKIGAIKAVREATSSDLRTAKEIVEETLFPIS